MRGIGLASAILGAVCGQCCCCWERVGVPRGLGVSVRSCQNKGQIATNRCCKTKMQPAGVAVIAPHINFVGPKILNATTRNCNAMTREGSPPLEVARVRQIRQDRREVRAMASEMLSVLEMPSRTS